MAPRGHRVRFRTPEVSELLDIFSKLGLVGLHLESSEDEAQRDVEALKPAISELRSATSTNGLLSRALDAVRPLIRRKKQVEDDETLWQSLKDEKLETETIVALLSVLAESESNTLAIEATSLYFALLQVPGAFMYHIFNALVFRTCTSSLKRWIYSVAGSYGSFLPCTSFFG